MNLFFELPVGTPFRYAHNPCSSRYVKVSAHYAEVKGRKTPTIIRADAEVEPLLRPRRNRRNAEINLP